MYYLRAFAPSSDFYVTTLWDYFIGVVLMFFIIGIFTTIRYFFGGRSETNSLIASEHNLIVSPFLIPETNSGDVSIAKPLSLQFKVVAFVLILLIVCIPFGEILSQEIPWWFW